MATRSERADEFFAPFEGEPTPAWSTAEDLGRLSIESLHGDALRRTERSAGVVHLAGEPAADHSARLREIGPFLAALQRVVTAIGASLEGAKSAVGPLSASVVDRTDLRMDTCLMPGSVVVNVFPESDPALELRPGGEMFDLGEDEPLVDRSLAEFEKLIVEVRGSITGGESDFVQHMRTLGPRVANAVRVLAEGIGDAGFDMDMDWRPPRKPSRHVAINPRSARVIQSLVERQRLEAEPFTVVGELHTASDRSSPWEVDTVEYGMIRVKHDQISRDDIRGLAVGMRVRLHVDRVPVRSASGDTHYEWTASRVDRLD